MGAKIFNAEGQTNRHNDANSPFSHSPRHNKKVAVFICLLGGQNYANFELVADIIWTLPAKDSLSKTHKFKSLENLLFTALFVLFVVALGT
jgi:hypothetical protein